MLPRVLILTCYLPSPKAMWSLLCSSCGVLSRSFQPLDSRLSWVISFLIFRNLDSTYLYVSPALIRYNWQIKLFRFTVHSVLGVTCSLMHIISTSVCCTWGLRVSPQNPHHMCLWGDGCSLNLLWRSFPFEHQNHRAVHLQLTQCVCVLSHVPLCMTPGL